VYEPECKKKLCFRDNTRTPEDKYRCCIVSNNGLRKERIIKVGASCTDWHGHWEAQVLGVYESANCKDGIPNTSITYTQNLRLLKEELMWWMEKLE
jgi:hypothetical protein